MRAIILLLFFLLLYPQGDLQTVSIPINSPGELGYNQTVSQDLKATPAQLQEIPTHPGYYYEGFYVLTFSVKNALVNYPGYYEVKLSFGTQELCDASGVGTIQFTKVTVTCPISNYIVIDKALPSGGPVQGDSDLVVTWAVDKDWAAWPLLFDNVSLTFTPEGIE